MTFPHHKLAWQQWNGYSAASDFHIETDRSGASPQYPVSGHIFPPQNVIPVLTDLRRKILEIVDLRWHSRRRPFICIIIPAISVLLKIYVLSPFSTFPRYSRIIRIVSSGDSTESASFNASLTKDSISLYFWIILSCERSSLISILISIRYFYL